MTGENASRGLYGWDWSATTHDPRGSVATRQEIVADLVGSLGGSLAVPGRGLQGWSESLQVFDGEGFALGTVYFGGDRQDVHVVSTSSAADASRGRVVGKYGAKTARVDTRVDSLVPLPDLVAICEEAAAGYGSELVEMRKRKRGESLGRTLYLGAATSAVRVRVYEKWLQSPGQYVEGTNRVEVQLRPPSKAKARVSSWTPAETFCASRVTRSLAERLGADLVPTATLHVSRGKPELEQTLAAMGRQYGPGVHRWLKASGGDLDKVLGYLLGSPRRALR